MKRIITIFLAFVIIPTFSFGQSVSKQINDIKRSSQYISAEATMETEAKAYELAEELLGKQISEYASAQKSLKKAPNVIVKDVAGKAEKMQMNRGTMVRVFLYVKKSDIIAADNTRVLVQNVPRQDGTPQKEIITKVSSEEQEFRDQNISSTVEPIESKIPEAGSDDISENENRSFEITVAESWKQAVIDELLNSGSIGEARKLMERYRSELKIKRYGSPNNCKNPEKSLWIIFNEQDQIVTILGEGNQERTNYRTNESDNLTNYSGKGAIWFTFAN